MVHLPQNGTKTVFDPQPVEQISSSAQGRGSQAGAEHQPHAGLFEFGALVGEERRREVTTLNGFRGVLSVFSWVSWAFDGFPITFQRWEPGVQVDTFDLRDT